MSLVIKNATAADTTFATTGFSGTSATFADVANTATQKLTGATKHTLTGSERRNLISFEFKVYDAVSGKWGFERVNLTLIRDPSGIVSDAKRADLVAYVCNYFTKNVAALSASAVVEIGKFVNGVSPV